MGLLQFPQREERVTCTLIITTSTTSVSFNSRVAWIIFIFINVNVLHERSLVGHVGLVSHSTIEDNACKRTAIPISSLPEVFVG